MRPKERKWGKKTAEFYGASFYALLTAENEKRFFHTEKLESFNSSPSAVSYVISERLRKYFTELIPFSDNTSASETQIERSTQQIIIIECKFKLQVRQVIMC